MVEASNVVPFDSNVPWAKMTVPTVTSDSFADVPSFENLVESLVMTAPGRTTGTRQRDGVAKSH